MKKMWIFAVMVILVAGCQQTMDKKAELDKLTKERDALTQKITTLQQEIAATDSTGFSSAKVKTVMVQEIQPAPFNHYIEIQGRVDGDENIGVNPRMPGVVSNILVKVGDPVKKGQRLIELDAEVTRTTINELQSQLDFATTVYKKVKNLWDQKIGSELEYLSAKNNKERLENSLKTLQETLAMSVITSPINGTVEEIPVKVGHAVSPGFPAIRVINFSKIKVVAELAEAYATRVKSGDGVVIWFPDFQKEVTARVTFSSKYINPVNRTFQVEANLSGSEAGYKANMIAVLKINDYSAPEALSVPVNVIQKSQQGTYVFVVVQENGRSLARKKVVQPGIIYNGLAEITTGLAKGDKVITMGYQDLYDGQPILF